MLLGFVQGLSIAQIAVTVIIIAAVVAIVWIALKAMGVNPPEWLVKILWVIVIAVVAIFAIKIVLSV